MKIKLDENIPARAQALLSELGHDVDTVVSEGLGGATDATVWQAAQEEQRLLITQDLDFSDITKFVPGTHCGILLIRLQNPSRQALTKVVDSIFSTEPVADWFGCFVVATERKVRVRRP